MATILNLLLPGVGIILLKKDWFGLLVSVLFAICANVWMAGALIAPAAIPAWLTWTAAVLSVLVWVFAQSTLRRLRAERARAIQRSTELAAEAREALARGDIEAAQLAVEGGLVLNPEDTALHALGRQIQAESRPHPEH